MCISLLGVFGFNERVFTFGTVDTKLNFGPILRSKKRYYKKICSCPFFPNFTKSVPLQAKSLKSANHWHGAFFVSKKQTLLMLVSLIQLLTCIHNIHHNNHHIKLQFINSCYYIEILHMAIILEGTPLIMPPGLGKIQAHLARQGRRDFTLLNQ